MATSGTAVLKALLNSCGQLAIIAAAVFAPLPAMADPNIVIFNPSRPANAAAIKATTGTIERYDLIANDSLLAERLVILDEVAQTKRTFTLSFSSQIDGVPFQCAATAAHQNQAWYVADELKRYHLCAALPNAIVPGKTKVVIVYWEPAAPKPGASLLHYDGNPASDAIYVVKDSIPHSK